MLKHQVPRPYTTWRLPELHTSRMGETYFIAVLPAVDVIRRSLLCCVWVAEPCGRSVNNTVCENFVLRTQLADRSRCEKKNFSGNTTSRNRPTGGLWFAKKQIDLLATFVRVASASGYPRSLSPFWAVLSCRLLTNK